jgi:hypothetical protein
MRRIAFHVKRGALCSKSTEFSKSPTWSARPLAPFGAGLYPTVPSAANTGLPDEAMAAVDGGTNRTARARLSRCDAQRRKEVFSPAPERRDTTRNILISTCCTGRKRYGIRNLPLGAGLHHRRRDPEHHLALGSLWRVSPADPHWQKHGWLEKRPSPGLDRD